MSVTNDLAAVRIRNAILRQELMQQQAPWAFAPAELLEPVGALPGKTVGETSLRDLTQRTLARPFPVVKRKYPSNVVALFGHHAALPHGKGDELDPPLGIQGPPKTEYHRLIRSIQDWAAGCYVGAGTKLTAGGMADLEQILYFTVEYLSYPLKMVDPRRL